MADFLDEKLREIRARLKELRPMVDEFHRLEAAERALTGVEAPSVKREASSSRKRTGAGTSRRSTGRAAGGSSKRGRPKGSGTRAAEALKLVTDRPGITIPELAEAMGIKQNYLYRVMPTLAEERKVVKSGRGWHVREQ